MSLYQQLVNGEIEYKDDGIVITHPPTTTALRAARHIKLLEQSYNQLTQTLIQAQSYNKELLTEQEQFRNEQQRLYNAVLDAESGRNSAAAEIKRLLDGKKQASFDACSDGRALRSYPAG